LAGLVCLFLFFSVNHISSDPSLFTNLINPLTRCCLQTPNEHERYSHQPFAQSPRAAPISSGPIIYLWRIGIQKIHMTFTCTVYTFASNTSGVQHDSS
jgi:hypothetical protein